MSKSDYEKLRDKWYGKLKKLGFEDIEQDEDRLKRWHSHDFLSGRRSRDATNNELNALNYNSKADYYYYATQFLNKHRFEKDIHKIIWEEHSNGASVRKITKSLNETGTYEVTKDEIWKIIKHYKEIMLKKL